MQAKRILLTEQGSADVMTFEEFDLPAPGPGEAQIEHTAVGLNYMDVYQRSGYYPLSLPSPLGLEAAGRVTAIGDGVTEVSVGDRVVYAGVIGAYATHRNAPSARLVKIPDGIDDDVAAAVMLKGMTVEYLLERTFKVGAGTDVLFYAASGGVGQMAGQWGAHLGARMIGVTSGPANCAVAQSMGYDAAIDRKSEDIAARVKELTNGKGVEVAYDSAGKATFDATINSLATFGFFVSFGATTGSCPDVSPGLLQASGSLYFTRPTLGDYAKKREDLEHSAGRVFELIKQGVLSININQRPALDDIVATHHALEAGTTTGSTVLTP